MTGKTSISGWIPIRTCSRCFSASSISDKRSASAIHEDMFKPGCSLKTKNHQVHFLKRFLSNNYVNGVNVTFWDYYLRTTMLTVCMNHHVSWCFIIQKWWLILQTWGNIWKKKRSIDVNRDLSFTTFRDKTSKYVGLVVSTPVNFPMLVNGAGSASHLLDGK